MAIYQRKCGFEWFSCILIWKWYIEGASPIFLIVKSSQHVFFLILQGEEIIVIIPWEEWWELALKDSSNPQIVLLPLHPDVRAKFNSTAAWEYARSMTGKPYGYHNMIFSWIDTIADNYPPPLDAHLVSISSKHIILIVFCSCVLAEMHLQY